jgi:hypothetical protein
MSLRRDMGCSDAWDRPFWRCVTMLSYEVDRCAQAHIWWVSRRFIENASMMDGYKYHNPVVLSFLSVG